MLRLLLQYPALLEHKQLAVRDNEGNSVIRGLASLIVELEAPEPADKYFVAGHKWGDCLKLTLR